MGLTTATVIFADFSNFDTDGFIRLNCIGTLRDLTKAGITLRGGEHLVVSDGDLRAEIEVTTPSGNGVWRGRLVSVVEEFDPKRCTWSPV